MYILSKVERNEPAHITYTLRSETEDFIINIYEDTATVTHQAHVSPVIFNYTNEAGEDLNPTEALSMLQTLVKYLQARDELINLCGLKV